MTYLQCSLCGAESDHRDDKVFETCNENRHEIIEMLGEGSASKFRKTAPVTSLSQGEHQKLMEKSLSKLVTTVDDNFTGRGFVVETLLSVKAQLKIEGITQVFALIMMGSPSSFKSTTLEIVSVLPDSYQSDSFTPRAFVSHSANTTKKDLSKVDLLPRIRHKTMITPELAPLFSAKPENIQEHFGVLTRILDGRGYTSDSGVHGQRGYSGDYHFMGLGAVVDIPHGVWRLLGNLGAKMYFFRIPADNISDEEFEKQMVSQMGNNTYNSKLEECKEEITKLWDGLETCPHLKDGKVIWNISKDDLHTKKIITKVASALASLRAVVPTWHTHESGGSNYNYETPTIENPSRASNALYNLARGHAVVCGRNYILQDDLRVVLPVALSSASKQRTDLFKMLVVNGGTLTTTEFEEKAHLSKTTALKEMEQLSIIGLADITDTQTGTKPIKTISIKSKYEWFLGKEFKDLWEDIQQSMSPSYSSSSSNRYECKDCNMNWVGDESLDNIQKSHEDGHHRVIHTPTFSK